MSTEPKSVIPTGTPLCLAPDGTVWRWAHERLSHVEDTIMFACRRGDMKRAEARVWIGNNIAPLEDSFLQGDRSIELLNAVTDLESPVKPPYIREADPSDVPRRDPKDK